MLHLPTRRDFLKASAGVAGAGVLAGAATVAAPPSKPVRVVAWDENLPAQKEAYDNFLGN